jgi:phage gp36-like protein
MAYCATADIVNQIEEDVLISLTDDEDAGAVNETVVADAISGAGALIDGYCGKRYSVPLATVPALVKKFCVDIAIYDLYSRRDKAPAGREKRYDAAVNFFKAVARGEATLGEDDPDETPSVTHAPEISSSTRIFSRDDMTGF